MSSTQARKESITPPLPFFSFAHLGDRENSWITDKCPTTTTTFRQDRCITPALYAILHQPYITPALYYTGPILHRPYITLAPYYIGPYYTCLYYTAP